jgi:hypothetical protein
MAIFFIVTISMGVLFSPLSLVCQIVLAAKVQILFLIAVQIDKKIPKTPKTSSGFSMIIDSLYQVSTALHLSQHGLGQS